MGLARALLGLAAVAFMARLIAKALWHLVWRPYAVGRSMSRQGVRGPPYRFALGSLQECRRMLIAGRGNALDAASHNYIPIVQPFFQKWSAEYGTGTCYMHACMQGRTAIPSNITAINFV